MFDGSLAVRRDVPLMTLFVDEVLALLAAAPSLEEFGAVMALRAVAWKAGRPLPDKPARLAGICKVSRRYWTETLRPAVVDFISVRDGYLRDDEMELQHAAALKRVEAARLKGRLGGLATAAARTQRVRKTYDLRKPNLLESNNTTPSWGGSKYNHRERVEPTALPISLSTPTPDSLPAAHARVDAHAAPPPELRKPDEDGIIWDGPPPDRTPRRQPTPEEIAAVDRMMAEMRERMAADEPAPHRRRLLRMPPRPLPEETPEYLAEFARYKAAAAARYAALVASHGPPDSERTPR